ncbi:DUF4347 domain-containing protein [Cupriavidus basilensis]|nr:DUF4347 domain-containing protein [Cupriavidus basilensis]
MREESDMWWTRKQKVEGAVAIPARPAKRSSPLSSSLIMALEPRIMFDGAAVATAAAAAHPAADSHGAPADSHAADSHPTDSHVAPAAAPATAQPADAAGHAPAPAEAGAPSSPAPAPSGHNVLFVDSRVEDSASLLAGVAPGTEIVYLNRNADGLAQMADYLSAHPGAKSVQIIAHGEAGDLWLGNTYLSGDNVGNYASSLARIGSGIQSGGDILIYACSTAQGAAGLSFVDSLAALTGRDIAASDNRTGAGSDWNLEITTGQIEATSVLSASAESAYAHDLALITVTNAADAGVGTLRNAISSAQAGDTITFSTSMTINLSTLTSGNSLLVINKNLTIDGDINHDGVADVTLDGHYNGRVLEITSGSTVGLEGLVIEHGLVSGKGGVGGSGATAAQGGGIYNAGTLTLTDVTVTANAAAGGGGGGGVQGATVGGGGGGGGGISGIGGGGGGAAGAGNTSGTYGGTAGHSGVGGLGGGYDGIHMGGGGGSTTGGAGGTSAAGYTTGGNGGTASNGSISIGGGGGGSGWDATGGAGGSAAGGIFNATGATLNVVGNSIISNNLGAGGGGGGGAGAGSGSNANGGAGGLGVGAIWNQGTVHITASAYAAMSGNAGASGAGGLEDSGGSTGISPASSNKIYNDTGATLDKTYTPNAPPVATASGGTTAFTEGNNVASTPVVVDSGVTFSDADNTTFASGKVAITGNFHSGEDVLAFTSNPATMGNISASYNSATGILTLTSSGATATTAQWQAALRSVTYTDSSDTPNTSNRIITFTVNDGTSDSNAAAKTVSVAAVDDSPIATASGGTTAFTEGNNVTSTPVAIDGGFTVSDADNTTLANATVAITGNFQGGEDVLAFTNNPATMGNISAVYNGVTGVMTLTSAGASATTAQWQAALRSVSYTDSSDTPNTSNRTISFTVNDGTANSNTVTKTLSVAAVDDTPVATTSGGTTAFTEGNNVASTPVAIDGGFTLSDLDNTTLASATVAVTGNFRAGEDVLAFTNDGATMGNIAASYNGGTGVMTLTSSGASATTAQWQAALRSVTYTDSSDTPNTSNRTISFTVNDGTADGNTATKVVTVAAVDDSPIATGSGGTTAFTEGNNVASTPVVIDSGIVLSDLDNTTLASGRVAITGNFQSGEDVLVFTSNGATMGNISASYNSATGILTLTSSGASATTAQWQAALRSVSYTDVSDTPNTSNRTISFTVNDGTADSNTVTKTLSVTAVDDTPIATASGGTTAFTEGNNVTSTPVAIDSGFTVSDADNTTLASATVAITGNFHSAEDVLAFTSNPATMGNISASYNSATGVMTLTSSGASATTAQWQAALRSVTYTDSSDTPNTSNRTISFTVNDGTADSNTVTKTVSVTAVDDTPIATASGGTTAFTEGNNVTSTPVAIDSGLTLSDLDNTTLASATVSITGNFRAAEDVLAFTNDGATMGNITASYNIGTGVMTLTSSGASATTAQWQAALRSVTYTDTSDLPNASNRTISFTVNDGTTDSAAATKLVSVDAVNDSPVNAVPAAQSVDQNSVLTFSAGNGNLISVSDVDSAGGAERVTLTASNGVITLSGTSSLTFLTGSGVGDATMTFTGTLADINAALNGLVYTPTPGYHGAGSIQITTNDQGLTGSGGAKTATDTIAITVNSINPVVTNVDALTANGTYKVGDTVSVVVTFDQAVTVDTTGGTPTLLLETGAVDRNATYISGSGTNTLTFRYTVQAGDSSADLDVASSAALALNGGVITNASSDAAVLTLPAVGGAHSMGGQHDIVVDGIAPTVATVSVPANGTYATGQNLDFTVNYGENVVVDTTGGTPRIAVTLDTGGTVYASYLSGSGTSALTFRMTVASGQLDSNGVSVASALDLHGGTVRDVAGNDAVTTLNSVASTSGVLVDAVAPSAVAVITADPTPTAGNAVHFTVTFSENVTGVDVSDFALSGTGTATGQVASVTQVDGHTYSVVVNNVTGDGQLGLDLKASGTGIADTAGNAIAGGLAGQRYVVDHSAPVVLGVSAPAGGDYNAGKVLDFTVSLSENTVIDTIRGTPRLALDVGGQTVYADYVSGSGTTALTFRYIVAAGQNDANGIAVTALQANGGTMRDSAGNAIDVSLLGVADTRAVTVDTTPPTAVGIARVDASPTSGRAVSYTVTFAEGVTGVDAADFVLTRTGSATGAISAVTQVDARTYTVLVTGLGGAGQIGLTLNASGTGIADSAGNTLVAGASGDPYEVRSTVHLTTQPAPAPVPVPGLAPLAPAASAPLITLTALDSAPGVDAPTLNPAGNGTGFSADAVGRNPFNADPLSAGSLSYALQAPEGRMNLVDVGGAGSIGLQAMPEIGSFSARAGEAVSIALPASLFRASDREATVTVEVRLANGRPLPPWLKFDPVTGTLAGKPPQGMNQQLQIEVTARDSKGNRASSHLDLNVKASADSRAGLEHADALAQGDGSHADPLAGLLQAATAQPAGKPALAVQFDQFGRPAQQAANAALLRHLQMSRQPQAPAQAQPEQA